MWALGGWVLYLVLQILNIFQNRESPVFVLVFRWFNILAVAWGLGGTLLAWWCWLMILWLSHFAFLTSVNLCSWQWCSGWHICIGIWQFQSLSSQAMMMLEYWFLTSQKLPRTMGQVGFFLIWPWWVLIGPFWPLIPAPLVWRACRGQPEAFGFWGCFVWVVQFELEQWFSPSKSSWPRAWQISSTAYWRSSSNLFSQIILSLAYGLVSGHFMTVSPVGLKS